MNKRAHIAPSGNDTNTRVSRTAILLAVGAVVVGMSALGSSSPAQAHNFLVSSTPTAGQTLTELPDAFDITTNEPLLALDGQTGGFAFQILDAAGLHYETGCVEVAGAAMTTEPRLGAAGKYTVEWQVVSEDGHTVSDALTFTCAPAAGFEPAQGAATAPACGDVTGEPVATPVAVPGSAPPVAQPSTSGNPVPLGDALWIGGALAAVGVAVAIAIVVMGRRKAP
ncbi:hypothetical protein BH09ACT4_BH09ACT4_07310 [soil metagenome]